MTAMVPALMPFAPIVNGHTAAGEEVLFWILGPLMVIGALGLLFSRRAIYAAMSMVLVMISMAVLYVTNEAEFLGMAQVVVYTGAVMMLFLFVLMLVGVDVADTRRELLKGQRWFGALLGLGLACVLIGVIVTAFPSLPRAVGLAAANGQSNPVAVSHLIFTDFVFDLEIVGILLITAAVGAVVLTHRPRLTPKQGQKELSIQRIKDGTQIPPLPAPGVYAHSNAADVPALDAQGRPLELSVPQVLRIRGQVRAPIDVESTPAERFDELQPSRTTEVAAAGTTGVPSAADAGSADAHIAESALADSAPPDSAPADKEPEK